MVAWTRSMPRQAPNSPGVNGLGSGAPSRSSAPLDSIPELLDIRKYFGYCLRTANNVAPREGRLAMTITTAQYTVLAANDGLRRALVSKVTGEAAGGAFAYFTVEVSPRGGPPLHLHHKQEETIHVVNGRFKVRIGEEIFELDEGGFAYLPSKVPHAFLNLTDAPAEIIVVYTPGGGHHFYEELGPATRNGTPDRAVVAAIFEKHDMSLLGPPLSDD